MPLTAGSISLTFLNSSILTSALGQSYSLYYSIDYLRKIPDSNPVRKSPERGLAAVAVGLLRFSPKTVARAHKKKYFIF